MIEKNNSAGRSTVSHLGIRQPIVTVCGHVDHGKTSILDCLRGSCVQQGEAGGITQKISFTSYPMSQLKKACPLIEKSGIKLTIPGFLLIDTPGHAAFTNLRKRGGGLADLAVLVIDINDGIKPQTAEVIQILRKNKTPFIIALNKIDNISGWKKDAAGNCNLKNSLEMQSPRIKPLFDERYMTIIGALNSFGLDADLFFNITDFTRKIALVPCSAKTKEGIPELIMMLCGLSQKYLENKLTIGKDAKGVMLEIKKENNMPYIEAILYDGELKKSDEIVIADLNGDIIKTKIRILEEIEPLSFKFSPKDYVIAATGIRMQLIEKEEILPGMPFEVFNGNLEEVKERFKKEISENITLDKQGIIAKADSLGSLEALLVLLKDASIPVVKATIGSINKSDIISAKANIEINEIDSVIAGFNVSLDDEAKEIQGKIKVITNQVIYKLIDDLKEFRENKRREIEKERMMGLTTLCKLRILHQYVFRNSNPAVFGIKVEGGKAIPDLSLMDNTGERVARIKGLQADKNSVKEAHEGMEIAVSLTGTNFERQLADKQFLYTDLGEKQFREFKKNKDLLTQNEIKVLQEIAEIRRKTKPEWGV